MERPVRAGRTFEVKIDIGPVELPASIALPEDAAGLVIFAHGSGSSRQSPRNQRVARELRSAGLATLLFDLLTHDEEKAEQITRHLRFDIQLLASRLDGATSWAKKHPELSDLPTGYFGASTGAAAALVAAAGSRYEIRAVVSRGGRPDLALPVLDKVGSAVLLIVGGRDVDVLRLNQDAFGRIRSTRRLEVIPGATHLFEEAGALERVSELARDWFLTYLGPNHPVGRST